MKKRIHYCPSLLIVLALSSCAPHATTYQEALQYVKDHHVSDEVLPFNSTWHFDGSKCQFINDEQKERYRQQVLTNTETMGITVDPFADADYDIANENLPMFFQNKGQPIASIEDAPHTSYHIDSDGLTVTQDLSYSQPDGSTWLYINHYNTMDYATYRTWEISYTKETAKKHPDKVLFYGVLVESALYNYDI